MDTTVPSTSCVQQGTQGRQRSNELQGISKTCLLGPYSTCCPQGQKDDGGTKKAIEFHWFCMEAIYDMGGNVSTTSCVQNGTQAYYGSM